MKKVTVDSDNCLQPCTGQIVTSFSHHSFASVSGQEKFTLFRDELNAYKKYKKLPSFPEDLDDGNYNIMQDYHKCFTYSLHN